MFDVFVLVPVGSKVIWDLFVLVPGGSEVIWDTKHNSLVADLSCACSPIREENPQV